MLDNWTPGDLPTPDNTDIFSAPTSVPSFPSTMLFAEDGFWDNEKKGKKKRKKGKKARKKAEKRFRTSALEKRYAVTCMKYGYLAAENDMLRKMIALSVAANNGRLRDDVASNGLKLLPREDNRR